MHSKFTHDFAAGVFAAGIATVLLALGLLTALLGAKIVGGALAFISAGAFALSLSRFYRMSVPPE